MHTLPVSRLLALSVAQNAKSSFRDDGESSCCVCEFTVDFGANPFEDCELMESWREQDFHERDRRGDLDRLLRLTSQPLLTPVRNSPGHRMPPNPRAPTS